MKTVLVALTLIMIVSTCKREAMEEQLPQAQLNAVQQMDLYYNQAKLYNDSLMTCIGNNAGAAMIAFCDSMYHHYDSSFQNCHNGYQHNLNSANHSHNSMGMVQMHGQGGGMMGGGGCNCCSNGGHSASIHNQMDSLHTLHQQYYPH